MNMKLNTVLYPGITAAIVELSMAMITFAAQSTLNLNKTDPLKRYLRTNIAMITLNTAATNCSMIIP